MGIIVLKRVLLLSINVPTVSGTTVAGERKRTARLIHYEGSHLSFSDSSCDDRRVCAILSDMKHSHTEAYDPYEHDHPGSFIIDPTIGVIHDHKTEPPTYEGFTLPADDGGAD